MTPSSAAPDGWPGQAADECGGARPLGDRAAAWGDPARLPVRGICRGMQILNVALGLLVVALERL